MKKQQNNTNFAAYLTLGAMILAFMGILGFRFGSLYILLLISLGIAISSKKYRKFIGVAIGITLLTSLIYIFLKNMTSLTQFFSTTRAISIVGLWLTSIGFIGKTRLEKWEENVKNLIQDSKNDKTAESVYQKQWGIVVGGLLLLIGALTGLAMIFARPLLSSLLTYLYVPPERQIYVLLSVLLASLALFFVSLFIWPFIGYALIIPLHVLLLPFHLADTLDKSAVAERGLVIIGLIMSTIGIILNY